MTESRKNSKTIKINVLETLTKRKISKGSSDLKDLKSMTDEDDGDFCFCPEFIDKLFELAESGKVSQLSQQIGCKKHKALFEVDENGQSLLHRAASCNQTEVVQFLIDEGLDVNAQDGVGNTALHFAVQKNSLRSLQLLLNNKADPNIVNLCDSKAPLHLAAELNRIDCVRALCDCPRQDVSLCGYQGGTAAHFACSKDSVESLEIIIQTDGMMCKTDSFGQSPAHIAVSNCSLRCLELIADTVQRKYNCDRKAVMNYKDKQDNVALHHAVNSGDPRAVKICLEMEADIDVRQEDGSTPVHFASVKGEVEMVRMMLDYQAEKMKEVLSLKDTNGHTALHKSVMFNHINVTRLLIERGSNLESRDVQENTALLLAARKSSTECICALLEAGADASAVDIDGRNMAHLGVISCCRSQQWNDDRIIAKLTTLLNTKDAFGSTPLHYATQRGNLALMDRLLHLGAACRVTNNERSTPLHFAAKYGRLNSCRQLVETCPQLLNFCDRMGHSPLHLAAQAGHLKIVKMLLQKGAVFQKDTNGDTSLHLAAANGHVDVVKALLGVHAALIDSQNQFQKTALHLAAQNGHSETVSFLLSSGAALLQDDQQLLFINHATIAREKEVVMAVINHDRWTEVLMSISPGHCPIGECIEHLPECAAVAYDRCIEEEEEKTNYRFTFLQLPADQIEDYEAIGIQYEFMYPLKLMIKLNRANLLTHPLTAAFLMMKWNNYGRWIHNTNLFIYIMFLGALTFFIWNFPSTKHSDNMDLKLCSFTPFRISNTQQYNTMVLMPAIVVCAFAIVNFVKELIQMFQQGWKYLTDFVNYVELSLYATSLIFAVPFLFDYSLDFQWKCGTMATLLAWMNFLLFFQRYESTGIYVIMFLRIANTLFKVMSLFSILIIGFGLSFFILIQYNPGPALDSVSVESMANASDFRAYMRSYATMNASAATLNETELWSNTRIHMNRCLPPHFGLTQPLLTDPALDAWNTPLMAIFKTLMMMLGEFDYIATFSSKATDGDTRTNHHSTTTMLLLILFVVLMPILLMNLLVGLAVGDIESVQKDATVRRIELQVDWFADMETKMPRRLLRFVDAMEFSIYKDGYCPFVKRMAWISKRLTQLVLRRSVTPYESVDETELKNGSASGGSTTSNSSRQQRASSNKFSSSSDPAIDSLIRHADETQYKIRKIEAEVGAQTQFLRMILAKMQIEVEEEIDEGIDPKDTEARVEVTTSRKERWRRTSKLMSQMIGSRPQTASGRSRQQLQHRPQSAISVREEQV